MPLRGNTDPSAQRGPAQRAGARQLYRIRCPGAPLPPAGTDSHRRPRAGGLVSRPTAIHTAPRLGLPAPTAPTEAVLCVACRASPGKAPPRPLLVGWASSTLLPRGGGRGEASPGLTPPPRVHLHTSPLARLKGPVKKLKRGCLTGKNSKGLSQGYARGPRPPGRGAGQPGLTSEHAEQPAVEVLRPPGVLADADR